MVMLYMGIHIRIRYKCLVTVLTLIWFDTCMNTLVVCKVIEHCKCLVTVLALMWTIA